MLNRRDVIVGMGLAAGVAGVGVPAPLGAAGGGLSYGWDPGLAGPTEATVIVALNGDDGAPGTADRPLRTIQAGVQRLAEKGAGSLAIRGGIYRETVQLGKLAGKTGGAPILIHRYGAERVTISAADVVTGWTPATPEDARALGTPVKGVYVLRLPRARLQHDAPLAINLHELGQWTSVATERADPDRLDSPSDDRRFFDAEPIVSAEGKVMGLRDRKLPPLSPAQIKGVRLLFHHAPNVVTHTEIASYDPATGIILLADQDQKVQRMQNQPVLSYALQNISRGLAPGRWIVREEDEGKTVAIYLVPRNPANLEGGIEISLRGTCLELQSAAHVRIVGLEFVRAAGDTVRNGAAILHSGADPERARDIGFNHCRVAETFSSASRGEGAINIRGLDSLGMRNFTVDQVRGAFGVALYECWGSDLRNLHLWGISQSAGRFFGAQQMIFAFSLIENSAWEAHANKFNFYQGSDTILVYGIRTRNVGGYVTYQKASRINFAFCEFDASASKADNRALVSQMRPSDGTGGQDNSGDPFPGGVFWYWNLLLGTNPYPDQPARALLLGPAGNSQHHSYHNCILYGGGYDDIYRHGGDPRMESRSYNLYTALAFWQQAKFGWAYGDHEGPLGPGQIPRQPGRDMREVIASLAPAFPTFTDWDRDIDFNPIDWGRPPIGCTVY